MILILDNSMEGGYMADEIAKRLPESELFNYPNEDGDPSLDGVDAIVIGGSEAGVYDEPDEPWITAEKEFVQEAIDREIPILGICFGHQLLHEMLGGTVVDSGVGRYHLVTASFDDDELLEGVDPVVPVLHSDLVTEPGEGLETIGRTDYNEYFASRHRDRPIWTVQYHPEFTTDIVDEYRDHWEDNDLSFEDSTAPKTLENFSRIVSE
ncbi:MAG TPA: gamma-glutamyl-gamma-aminobutyrate hydrolase family protein [Natrialbaceae archaeon]|nr:gamma-glutamyl-gamma-aminobutyrate hydrolase family protein [Natrialbaceae archaeon]